MLGRLRPGLRIRPHAGRPRDRPRAGQNRSPSRASPRRHFPDRAFDVVTSFDVLYALDAPAERAAVDGNVPVTRPGGYVIVNVAAMDILRGDHSGPRPRSAALQPGVARHAARPAAGFVHRAHHLHQRLALRADGRRCAPAALARPPDAKSTRSSDIQVPPAPVNLALAGAPEVESWWLHVDNPFGSSLLCLARKPE